MKYIKNYKVFENSANLTQEQIDFLNRGSVVKHKRKYETTWKVDPETGLIDILGSFTCTNQNLNDFKGLRFGKVTEGFFCNGNNLKTLDGSPREVRWSFGCWDNPLISLKGAPLKMEIDSLFIFCSELQDDHFSTNCSIKYNLEAFLEAIEKDRPGTPELLLTHHFLTPQVIKHKSEEDDKFCIAVGRAWNREGFENKRTILENSNDPNGLSPETLQKIKDFSAVSGYL